MTLITRATAARVGALTAGVLLWLLPPSCLADVLADKSDLFVQQLSHGQGTAARTAVIVRFHRNLTTAQRRELTRLGADIYRNLPFIQSAALTVPTGRLKELAALPYVRRLSADVPVRRCDQFTVASSGADVAYSQYGLTGSGVGVAVVDSGILDQPDLDTPNIGGTSGCRIVANVSYVSDGYKANTDPCGHGTHIAGIIAGNGTSSTGTQFFRTFYGIARQAKLINVRVLGAQGQGTVSAVSSGIQWVINNKSKYNIRVMNLSLGHSAGESYTTDPLCQSVEQAWNAGIVVVCAAGNSGRLNAANTAGLDNEGWGTAYGSIQCPGNDPYVITVGATKSFDGTRADDRIATYSSRGPTRLDLILKPDIVAPGNLVISTSANSSYLYTTYPGSNLVPWQYYSTTQTSGGYSNKYFKLSGTSMAAPVVSGAVALLLQANPSLSPDTVKARLMVSADKWGFPDGTSDACTFGAGYLNIPAALNCTVVATQPALSPFLIQDCSGNVNVDTSRALWGTNAIWGTGITDLHAIWGVNAIWGTTTL